MPRRARWRKDVPLTEEGAIVGSVPYMSPEQAEGKPVDARSDIFSFGAVLYEMITGQRAFRGESRISTLAAIVEREPQPLSEISASTPPELERLITRCLRKDVNRRSQNMADVKLALEELRDESVSGKLVRPAVPSPAGRGRWLWPAVAVASVLIAAAAIGWTWLRYRSGTPSQGPELIRLSPDDGHSYSEPAISSDGKFVAYISDRTGKDELWLQQVGGGDPIQLTHSAEPVAGPVFYPDGTRILYSTTPADRRKATIEVIPTLGGQPRVLVNARAQDYELSPDGRQIVYVDRGQPAWHLMIVSSDGGQPRELSNWTPTQGRIPIFASVRWTPDGRHILCQGSKRADATNLDEWEWFVVPVDGGSPVATGAGDALRAAGLRLTSPALMTGDRVLFGAGKGDRKNVWEIRLSPESWRVKGAPRQLTFGTLTEDPNTISATGTIALETSKVSTDLYLIPVSRADGQPTGVARRLTRDGRLKLRMGIRGDFGSVYFVVEDPGSRSFAYNVYGLELESDKQTLVIPSLALGTVAVVSADGRQIAYSIPEGDAYSIRIGEPGAGVGAAHVLCKGCGFATLFSGDGRFLMYQPEVTVKRDPRRKYTVRLLEVATGKDRPWLEHQSDSILHMGIFGEDHGWVMIGVAPPGSQDQYLITHMVPWRDQPVPPSEWIPVNLATETNLLRWDHFHWCDSIFLYFFQGPKFMAKRFDPRARGSGEPFEVKFAPGSQVVPKPDDGWEVRGPGLVLTRPETTSSVWLMKLPQ
jgi:hypothetical protein